MRQSSIRLTDETRDILQQKSQQWGLTQAQIIEVAVRSLDAEPLQTIYTTISDIQKEITVLSALLLQLNAALHIDAVHQAAVPVVRRRRGRKSVRDSSSSPDDDRK